MAYCAQQFSTSMLPFYTKKPEHSGLSNKDYFRTGLAFATPLSRFLKLQRNVDTNGFTAGHLTIVRAQKQTVAIDLGTTNSVVAGSRFGESVPVIIPSNNSLRYTPSVVGYNKNGDCIVGVMAKQQAAINPENTFSSVKNFIGKKKSEVDKELEEKVSFSIVAGDDNNNVRLNCPALGKHIAVEEIYAQVLKKLVNDASRFLKDEVTGAMITVPARFNDAQVKATKDAGFIAGLDGVGIIREPVAASMAYVYEEMKPQILLVFDLGGTTFDATVVEVKHRVEMLSTSGDIHLGGDDFNKKIVDWLALNFKIDEGIDLLEDKQALHRLTETAEKVKKELTSAKEAEISIPFITTTASGPKHIKTTLTRAKFEELCADLLDRLTVPVKDCIRDAKLSIKDLDGVILVGGSTHIPAVHEHVKKLTGIEPNRTIDPEEVVALGAAVVVARSGRRFTSYRTNTLISIGLETTGGVMTKVIPRNTTFPISKSEVFSTATDGQTSVKINVLQGEGEFLRNTKSLGCIRLDGIPAAPCGVIQIRSHI